MKKFLPLIALVATLNAGERPALYPFDVTLGGTKAEMKAGNELFAEVSKPVAADAVLSIEKQVPMLIINAFPCGDDGSIEEDQPAAVIFAQNVKEVKLDATMDKNKLKPGSYLANVVADDKTSRIVFVVAAPDTKPAVDFSKVLGFLKKKTQGDK
ncbi:hypothetical protein [Luteolibacter luteus]|uniref:Uncharacterized protein n=1 Tax=Luteolibacter luteus TaxID=2728835 RepID=A0A858RL62_9BACT|nr:hypothetical protein [Luteolibacter luteus]QJE97198.1 hypothetical protein HHL09_15855 [Luteolibacter luteus]